MFLRRGGAFALVAVFSFFVCLSSLVSAIGVSQSDTSATLATVSVSSASNLYGYEVAFDYSGSIGDHTSSEFLGSGTVSGTSTRNGIAKVYESKVDGTTTGVSGSGTIFTLAHTGTLTLRYVLAAYADGSSEYVYYNNSVSSGGSTPGASASSGGGGGAGGAAPAAARASAAEAEDAVTFSLDELIVTLVSMRTENRTITLTNEGDTTVVLTLSSVGLNDTLDLPETVTLAPGESQEISFGFSSRERRLAVGTITFSVDNLVVKRLPVILNARSENFLFDTTLSLARSFRTITEGETLVAQIDMMQVGRVDEQVDVVATYSIQDFSGNTYFEESETLSVLNSKEYTKEFFTETLKPGTYVLALEVVYPGAFATASTQFNVARPLSLTTIMLGVVIAVVLLTFILLIVWSRHRRSKVMPPHSAKHRPHRK